MKRFRAKPTILKICLFAAVSVLMFASLIPFVPAAQAKVIPIYSDQAATQPIESVSFPDVSPGSTATFTVYIKNTGTSLETITAGNSSVSPSVGTLTLTFDGSSQETLAAGAVSQVVGTLNISSCASSGPSAFTFAVNATP